MGRCLKPLEWRPYCEEGAVTDTVFGSITVDRDEYSGWQWRYCFDEYYDEDTHNCDSLEEGKAMAEAFYLERLEPYLEPAKEAA